ncbi:hypothetical protein RRG08_023071 [Elysia crispata]|uniref:Uncharacterized protein n=1 Tax=Elysia crispata TaxID=231223 RepID=A0AAE1ARU2_9GAST|nr:hypothetical protein RRG08_023071 [Elysia crispata]
MIWLQPYLSRGAQICDMSTHLLFSRIGQLATILLLIRYQQCCSYRLALESQGLLYSEDSISRGSINFHPKLLVLRPGETMVRSVREMARRWCSFGNRYGMRVGIWMKIKKKERDRQKGGRGEKGDCPCNDDLGDRLQDFEVQKQEESEDHREWICPGD